MAEKIISTAVTTTIAGAPTPPPVASGPSPVQPGNTPLPVPAGASVPLFGGNRGGRTRKDGLVPGSAVALEADRKRDRDRKQAARVSDPAPLPSANGAAPNPVAPPAGDLAAVPGAPVVAWDADPLRPLFDGLVSTLEQMTVAGNVRKAAAAHLPAALLKQIEADSKWDALSKTSLVNTGPKCAADALNEAGISGKYQPLSILGLTAVIVAASCRWKSSKVDQTIAEYTKLREEKKP